MTTTCAARCRACADQLGVPLVQRAHRHHDGDAAGLAQRPRGRPASSPRVCATTGRSSVAVGHSVLLRSAQHVQQRLGAVRRQPARRRAPARRSPGRARRRPAGRPASRSRSSRRCAATVPASPRATGPVRAASPRRSALSSAVPSNGPITRSGPSTPAWREHLHGLRDQGHQVVRAVGEGRVVARPVGLVDPDRLAADLDDQRLGHRPGRLAVRSRRSSSRPARSGRPRCR